MPKHDSVLAKLGLNVRKRREARELTQEKLAEKSGLDPKYTLNSGNKIPSTVEAMVASRNNCFLRRVPVVVHKMLTNEG
jgi:predicted transcriptional regulator